MIAGWHPSPSSGAHASSQRTRITKPWGPRCSVPLDLPTRHVRRRKGNPPPDREIVLTPELVRAKSLAVLRVGTEERPGHARDGGEYPP